MIVLPRGRHLEISNIPLVMGILNVTPDSFSDGGMHFDHSKAVHAAMQMEEDGAAIIDIGGESTRPGAATVTAAEEIGRVVPAIKEIRQRSGVVISIDTTKAAVAEAALSAGADMVNDVSALRDDPAMLPLVARSRVPIVLMHRRGDPRTMQQLTQYNDVVDDVATELRGFVARAIDGGVDAKQIFVDPGIGFAKNSEQNLEILARCGEFRAIAPVVIGASRKAFIGNLTGRPAGPDRMVGSLAAVAAAFRGCAAIVRVHDVRPTVDFLKVIVAIDEKVRA